MSDTQRNRPWTRAERDAWREQVRREYPTIKFVPNSEELARRLGAYSQREKKS